MLDLIRKKQNSVLIKLAFAIIILSFVIGYAMLTSPGGTSQADKTVVLSINDTEVTNEQFNTIYNNINQFYRSVYGNSFNAEMEKLLNLQQVAYDQIVRQILLTQEGERLDIAISKDEVIAEIAKNPQFQDGNGVFLEKTYMDVLTYQRIKEADYIAEQKRTLLVTKTEAVIQDNVTVTDADIEEEFVKQNETVDLSFVRLNPTDFEKKVTVTDAALEAFFDENKEQFRAPKKISLRYLQFDPSRYTGEVTLDQEEIEKFYRRNRDLYLIEEEVTAAHILIKVNPTDSDEKKAEKRELAEKVLAKAKAGEDFATLAGKYSDDTGSAAKGGDLGAFNRGSMVPEFEQTAFALKPDEISELVETQFGLHIIKVSDYVAQGVKPLSEVQADVEARLQVEKAEEFALEKARDAYNINRKTGDLEKAAKDFDLGIKETGLFTRTQSIDGIGKSPKIIDAAFALEEGQLARPITFDNNIFVVMLKELQPSHIPELASVKAAVETAYRQQEAKGLADAAAAQMLADLKGGKKLSTLARAFKAKIEQTGPFARPANSMIPKIGSSEKLATEAFELTAEASIAPEVYEIGGRYIVASLNKRVEADLKQLDETKRAELKETVLAAKRTEALDSRIAALKKDAVIVPSNYILSLGVQP